MKRILLLIFISSLLIGNNNHWESKLFNPLTTINYDLPNRSRVNLVIYDIMGREVLTLLNEDKNEGYHSIIWNTRNNLGTPVSAGIYFYHIQPHNN